MPRKRVDKEPEIKDNPINPIAIPETRLETNSSH